MRGGGGGRTRHPTPGHGRTGVLADTEWWAKTTTRSHRGRTQSSRTLPMSWSPTDSFSFSITSLTGTPECKGQPAKRLSAAAQCSCSERRCIARWREEGQPASKQAQKRRSIQASQAYLAHTVSACEV